MTPLVRPAAASDARAIAEVHVAGWQQGYRGLVDQAHLDALSVPDREHGWLRVLDRGDAVLVHVQDDQVDAFTCYGPCRDEDVPPVAGEVYALYVHPRCWRSGTGARLLGAAVAELRAAAGPAAPAPVLWVLEGNQRARRFYESQGWAPDGPRRRSERPATGAAPAIAFTEVRHRLAVTG